MGEDGFEGLGIIKFIAVEANESVGGDGVFGIGGEAGLQRLLDFDDAVEFGDLGEGFDDFFLRSEKFFFDIAGLGDEILVGLVAGGVGADGGDGGADDFEATGVIGGDGFNGGGLLSGRGGGLALAPLVELFIADLQADFGEAFGDADVFGGEALVTVFVHFLEFREGIEAGGGVEDLGDAQGAGGGGVAFALPGAELIGFLAEKEGFIAAVSAQGFQRSL